MEYTKDMILNVRYVKANNLEKRWTSRFIQRLKKHKLAVSTIALATIFISIDAILIMNFFNILAKL